MKKTIKDYLADNNANNIIHDDNVSIDAHDNGKTFDVTISVTTEDDELETIIEVDYNTPIEDVVRMVRNVVNNLLNPKTYHIKGLMDSMIEVNFGENKFDNLKEAYLAAKENLEYCDVEITEPSTGLRILLTSDEIEIWNKTPYVHFKQQRPRTYKDLENIMKEVFFTFLYSSL